MLELYSTIRRALEREGVINVPEIALRMKELLPGENVSVREIEAQVMAVGQTLNAAMLFQNPVARSGAREAEPVVGKHDA